MLEEAIRNFPKQFAFEPEIKNADKLKPFESLVIGGMGGSGLIAGILRALKPEMDIAAHHDYGLPAYLGDPEKRLFIASSYSGNTEETIDFFENALEKKLNIAAISVGGKLLERSQEERVPFVQLPDTGIQPRMSLGFMLRAVLKLIGEDTLYKEAGKLRESLRPEELELKGRDLAEALFNQIPVIYTSRRNLALACNWKIGFNEGGKVPAFYNTFPELNHNEMQGFSAGGGSAFGGDIRSEIRNLSDRFHFIFLKDSDDHPRIQKRMEITQKLYEERRLPVSIVELEGTNRIEKIFNSLILAYWVTDYTAKKYGVEPEAVPMIEEFKNLIK